MFKRQYETNIINIPQIVFSDKPEPVVTPEKKKSDDHHRNTKKIGSFMRRDRRKNPKPKRDNQNDENQ